MVQNNYPEIKGPSKGQNLQIFELIKSKLLNDYFTINPCPWKLRCKLIYTACNFRQINLTIPG